MWEFRIHTNWPLISKAISFIQGGDFNFISEQNWIGEQLNRLQECGFAFSHCSCWLKLCLCSQFIWGLRVAASVFKDGWTVTFNKWDLFAIYMLYIWLRQHPYLATFSSGGQPLTLQKQTGCKQGCEILGCSSKCYFPWDDPLLMLYEKSTGQVNPLTPMSDQDRIFPYSINTTSSTQVKRKKENMNYGLLVDPVSNSPTLHHNKCMANSKENY